MTLSRKRAFAIALVFCMLLPLFTEVRATDAEPIADAPLAETPETAVPATESSVLSEPIEAETQLSLSDSGIRVIKGESKSLLPEPEQTRGDAALGTSSAANPLTAPGVVWTSSDPTVATVDSTGTVTANKLGVVTITATRNGEVIQTFTVYSSLESGYYAISEFSSLYYMPHYMCATQISMQNNVTVYSFSQDDLNADGVEEEIMTSRMLGCVWYIKEEEPNVYSIRPAYSHAMVLTIYGGALASLQQQSQVTNNSWKWEIVDGDYGYVLQNKQFNDLTVRFTESGSSGSFLTVTEIDVYDEYQGWCFDYAEPPAGLLMFDTSTGNLVKDTFNISSGSYSVYAPYGQQLEFSDVNTHLQTLNPYSPAQTYSMTFSPAIASFNTNTLKFTGNSIGTTTATVSRTISGTTYSLSLAITFRKVISVVHYYDSTLSGNVAAIENMSDALTFANKAYNRLLGLFLVDVVSNQLTNAPVDVCPHGAGHQCENSAGCGGNSVNTQEYGCQNHHKNLSRISDQYSAYIPDNYIHVLWSDSAVNTHCLGSGENHVLIENSNSLGGGNVYAAVFDHRPFIHVFRFEGTGTSPNSTLREAFMGITLAHEIAHTAGMDDVYGDDHDAGSGYQCLMEHHQQNYLTAYYNAVLRNEAVPFCSSCVNTLKNKIASNPYD